jgi:serine/threonine protein kinase
MKWKTSYPVTVKKLTEEALKSGQIDLMISELKSFRRIAHSPKILSLMGFCQCDNADNMFLIFERIQCGSLYFTMHEMEGGAQATRKLLKSISIALNVCDALMFLHEHNIVHNYVNSHSIFITDKHTAKLGNLEYAVEK